MENNDKIIKEVRKKILKGLALVHKKLIEEKIKNKSVIVISKNGRIVYLDPKKIKKK